MALDGEAKSAPEPQLDKTRHIRYWTRCLKTLLPHQYTSNESNRMYLAYFMLSALDLLGALQTHTTPAERADCAAWIYRCQHPRGGFRMWPGTDFGDRATAENAKWDPANVPATYFALAALVVLGDDLAEVRRGETLEWLRGMQRVDGSFGETLVAGRIEGGRDPRFGYCAAGVRFILRGKREGPVRVGGSEVADVDVDGLVRCIQASESFDGGIADAPFCEPHAGYTFCSLGALNFVGRLNTCPPTPSKTNNGPILTPSTTSPRAPIAPLSVLHWLALLQTPHLDPDTPYPSPPSPEPPSPNTSPTHLHQSPSKSTPDPTSLPFKPSDPADPLPACDGPTTGTSTTTPAAPPAGPTTAPSPTPPTPTPHLSSELTAFAGRPNKPADTCYAFWAGASIALLTPSPSLSPQSAPQQAPLFNTTHLHHYLIIETQHPILGGFGKFPGDVADLYHSYLGLAGVSLCDEMSGGGGMGCDDGLGRSGLKALDAGMCVSKEAVGRLTGPKGIWEQWGVGME